MSVLLGGLVAVVSGCASTTAPSAGAPAGGQGPGPAGASSTTVGTTPPAPTPTSAGPVATTRCRTGPPLADVYHPDRLTVVTPCATVSGTVMSVRYEQDGDVHFDLALDPPYRGMLTAANAEYQHGWLVAEIVPADESGCTPGSPPRPPHGSYDYGVCTGADESPPPTGAHVSVTGPYVIDRDHGSWAEIHPAWSIAVDP